MEVNPPGQVRVGEDEAESLRVGGGVDVIVVEDSPGEMVGGEDEGSERERARAHEGDAVWGPSR